MSVSPSSARDRDREPSSGLSPLGAAGSSTTTAVSIPKVEPVVTAEGHTRGSFFSNLLGGRKTPSVSTTKPRSNLDQSSSASLAGSTRASSSQPGSSGTTRHARASSQPPTLLTPAEESEAEQGSLFDRIPTQNLVWGILDVLADAANSDPSHRWREAKSIELYATALHGRITRASSYEELFVATAPTSPEVHTAPLFSGADPPSTLAAVSTQGPLSRPIPMSSIYPATTPGNLPAVILKISTSLGHPSAPTPVRIAGFRLLAAFLTASGNLLSTDLVASDLSSFLRVLVNRLPGAGIEDLEARIAGLRALVAGEMRERDDENKEKEDDLPGGLFGESSAWDGWAEWSEIVGELRLWQQELERAWLIESAGAAIETLPHHQQPTEASLPPLLASLSLFELLVRTRSSHFTSSDLAQILALFARLAWHGLDTSLASAAAFSVTGGPEDDCSSSYVGDARRDSDTSAGRGGGGTYSDVHGTFETLREAHQQASRGRVSNLFGPSAPSTASSVVNVSRSPSVSRKALPTTSTSYSSPVTLSRSGTTVSAHSTNSSSKAAAAGAASGGSVSNPPSTIASSLTPAADRAGGGQQPQPFSPASSTRSASFTTYSFTAPLAPHTASAIPVHPLCSSFVRFFGVLAKAWSVPPGTVGPSARLLFGMLSLGGETERCAWPIVMDLFRKDLSDKFKLALKATLAGSGFEIKARSEEWGESSRWEIGVVRGGVCAIRLILAYAYAERRKIAAEAQQAATVDLTSSVASLGGVQKAAAAAASQQRELPLKEFQLDSYGGQLRSAMACNRCTGCSEEIRQRWMPVDLEVLRVLETILEDAKKEGMDNVLGEGETIVTVLEDAKAWIDGARQSDGKPFLLKRARELSSNPSATDTSELSLQELYGHINRTLPRRLWTYVQQNNSGDAGEAPLRLPRRQASLVLDLAANSSELVSLFVIDHYRDENTCLPFHPEWLNNLSRLVKAFYHPAPNGLGTHPPSVRKRMADLLFNEVWPRTKNVNEDRTDVLRLIILPVLEQSLDKEREPDIEKAALAVLVDAAILETRQMDDEGIIVLSEEQEITGEASYDPYGEFDRIRNLFRKIASETTCTLPRSNSAPATADLSPTMSPTMSPPSSIQSPDSSLRDLPQLSLSAFINTSASAVPTVVPASPVDRSAAPSPPHLHALMAHSACRSPRAALAFISIFTRLAFVPTTTGTQQGAAASSSRSILIFRDILDLVRPHPPERRARDGSPLRKSNDQLHHPRLHATCPRARLHLLRWLLHLRADTQHRALVSRELEVSAGAGLLGRSVAHRETAAAAASHSSGGGNGGGGVEAPEMRRGRPGRGSQQQGNEGNETEGRGRNSSRAPGQRDASRSRSRMIELGGSRSVLETPLWYDGDPVAFELPTSTAPSSSMNTFDPQRRFVVVRDESILPQGVWLPVSEYVQVIGEVLAEETDWELVSFVLCYFPLQLVNQHFFCGPRSKQSLHRFVDSLCAWLGPNGRLPYITRLPTGVKKAAVQAVTYQTLDVLISYHRQFSQQQHSALVRAFHVGVPSNDTTTGRACVQALTTMVTMAVGGTGSPNAPLEHLRLAVTKDLTAIMETLSTLTSDVSLSVHILEFIYAVSQNRQLYANFTTEQFETVFAVALHIIRIHHDSANDTSPDKDLSDHVLSQHMLQLAYFVMYPWFLALDLTQRVQLVPFILRQLISAKPDLEEEDPRMDVCMDFLHRYAYSNADSKPARSFLGELVLPPEVGPGAEESGDIERKYWVQGDAVVRVRMNRRTGWGRVSTFRPSGTVAMMVKLENIPLIALGNEKPDLITLPAVLAGERPHEEEFSKKELADMIRSVPDEPAKSDPSHNLVWSGTAPSQRRKEVLIDSSFVAQQFFPYPSRSDDPPRLVTDAWSLKVVENLDPNYPPVDLFTIGVLYVGPGQTTQEEIYNNRDGSQNYTRFIHGLGRVVKLLGQTDIRTGLDTSPSAENGEYTYAAWDDMTILAFHVATLQPNRVDESGQQNLNKRKGIGNSFACIVFNDSGDKYDPETCKTAFHHSVIVISPHTAGSSRTHDDPDEHNYFKVVLHRSPGVPDFGPVGAFKIVSAASLPTFVRQLAFLGVLMSGVYAQFAQGGNDMSSWKQRLRFIGMIRERAISRDLPSAGDNPAEALLAKRDFTRGL